MSNDAAGFASATDRSVAPPNGAFDAGLRPGPFPDRAASLLPGLLAATRTGLTPAGDDELMLDHDLHIDLQLWAHPGEGASDGRARRRVDEQRRKTARQRDGLAALGWQLSTILLECAATGELPLARVCSEVALERLHAAAVLAPGELAADRRAAHSTRSA